jgi:hypothetical protein
MPRLGYTPGQRKLTALVEQYGSLVELSRLTHVRYTRLRRMLDGHEPYALDAHKLVAEGISLTDWTPTNEA